MDEELTKTLKYLRLWGLLAHWDEYLALAGQRGFSPARLLRYVLEEESKIRPRMPASCGSSALAFRSRG